MSRLDGKVAVITGGASGIGAQTARQFIAEGASVVVSDLDRSAGEALVAELGDASVFAETNVTVEADIAAAVDLAVSEFGQLDIMFNNAGIVGANGPIAETTEADWDNTVDILLKSVFLGMKHASRVMRPRGTGTIISTASTAGVMGGLGPHLYTAAKHGVVGLTKSVANELGPHGITVNSVAPGSTVSPMTAAVYTGDPNDIEVATERIAKGSLLGIACLPEDIANAVVYLACDESRYVNGHCLVVDAGLTTASREPNRMHS